jgi:hypothetical protein
MRYAINSTQYRYLPNGSLCTILRDFPDRHRLRIKLGNGQELDEVAYHEVAEVAPTPAPAPVAPELPAATHPEVDPDEGYPLRGRASWNRGTRRGAPEPPAEEA